MPAVILSAKITGSELNLVKQEYGEYVKIVVDIQKNLLAAGGEWHADAEKLLLEQGSQQKNLWGAGLDLVSGQIDYVSLINTRPSVNNSQEVTDPETRRRMESIIKRVFPDYVR